MKTFLLLSGTVLLSVEMIMAQRIYCNTEPVTGKKDIVSVEIPVGWFQDNTDNHGVIAHQVLAKKNDSRGILFIQSIAADDVCKTPESIIVREKMTYDTKQTTVQELMPIPLDKRNLRARIVRVSNSPDGEQLAAFIPVRNGVVAITLCSSDKDFVEEHVTTFENVIRSFRLNPIINPPAYAELIID